MEDYYERFSTESIENVKFQFYEPLNELKAKKIWSTFLTNDDYLILSFIQRKWKKRKKLNF